MQRGAIVKHHGSWTLRYYDTVLDDGQHVRKKVSKRLAPVSEEYPTKRSVLLLAEKILGPLNAGQVTPDSAMPVAQFIEKVYLPFVKLERRPSTYKDYSKDVYERHLKHRLGKIRVRDFQTVTGQRLIAAIAKDNASIGHKTLLRIKSFLSGTFKHAKREGLTAFENPMRDVSVPGRPKKFRGEVYTMSEIENIGEAVGRADHRAFAAVSVAAFGGLRHSEIRGLRWADYDGRSLRVSRAVWRTHVGPTKTEESEASVPVLPLLAKILDDHHTRTGGADTDYIFRGERRGSPLNLHNLVRRVILPALNDYACEIGTPIPWKGWQAFRRGLASNLYDLGVKPKVIQAILRHSDIGTTLAYYVETPDEETRAALAKIEERLKAI